MHFSPTFPATPAPPELVVSLVVTLAPAAPARAAALAALRTRAELEIGALTEHWLPVVAVTPFPRELHRWVESLPGVTCVDVAFVEIADQPESAPAAVRESSVS